MRLKGPSLYHGTVCSRCYQCSCMGPAHSELFPPMGSCGPSNISADAHDALLWAQQAEISLHQWQQMGPASSLVGILDALVWAQFIQNYFHRPHRLGPASSLVGILDALVWAQHTLIYFHRWHHLGPASSLAGILHQQNPKKT